jgi:hypothetical protein
MTYYKKQDTNLLFLLFDVKGKYMSFIRSFIGVLYNFKAVITCGPLPNFTDEESERLNDFSGRLNYEQHKTQTLVS